MLMVGTDLVEVERSLAGGGLACPGCGGVLGPWGHARSRSCRGAEGPVWHRPRRARCGSCGRTHVLLAQVWLLRRADAACVIGAALEARATGAGHRAIAAVLGRPVSTVRGWLRRFSTVSQDVRAFFTRLLYALDPAAPALVPRVGVVGDAVEAIGRAAAAGVLRLGPAPPWEFAARASAGGLLSPPSGWPGRGVVSNTS